MRDIFSIEKYFYPTNRRYFHRGQKNELFDWFINQSHIPFDISSDAPVIYHQLYEEFLQELYKFSLSAKGPYFWFTNDGKLVNCGGGVVISGNSIYMDKVLLRNFKIDTILRE
jgi:hypothetical protein